MTTPGKPERTPAEREARNRENRKREQEIAEQEGNLAPEELLHGVPDQDIKGDGKGPNK